jgi:hypothetical protein
MEAPQADPTQDADREKASFAGRPPLPPAPSRFNRCLRVVLLEYGLPLLLVGAALTTWQWWRARDDLRLGSGVVVVVSDPLTEADAVVVPTDTQLRTTPADVFSSADKNPAVHPSLARIVSEASDTLAAQNELSAAQRVRLGDVVAMQSGPSASLFLYTALFDKRFRIGDPGEPDRSLSGEPLANTWSPISPAWAGEAPPARRLLSVEPIPPNENAREPNAPGDAPAQGPPPEQQQQQQQQQQRQQSQRNPYPPGRFVQPDVVTSAAMSALLQAERRGARVVAFLPQLRPYRTYKQDDASDAEQTADHFRNTIAALGRAMGQAGRHLQSVRRIMVWVPDATNSEVAAETKALVAKQWPSAAAWSWIATPLPWPGGSAFGEKRITDGDARQPAINPAYKVTGRTTVLPTLLYVLVAGAMLFACLWMGPEWQRTVFRPGVILGFLSVAVLLLLQRVLASLWIWAPDSWIANTAGMSFIGTAAGLVMGRSMGELRHFRKRPAPAPPQRDSPLRSVLYSDRPLEDIAQDRLGFAPLVGALHRFLDNPDTKPPVVLAVNGPWGSGKSSLMKMLASELTKTGRFRIVWHNSWQYHEQEQVLAAFLQSIASQLSENWGPSFALRLAWTRFKDYSYWQHLGLVASVVFAVLGAWAARQGLSAEGLNPAVTAAAGAIGLGGLAWIREILLPFNRRFRKLWSVNDQSKRLGFLDEFAREFRLYREAVGSRSKFLIVIDDLDRCAPEHVVDVLKTINLIITNSAGAGRSFFILGYDAKYILRAIKTYYRDKSDPNDARFGPEYLKKMITVSVSVPVAQPDEIQSMVAALDGADAADTAPATTQRPRGIGAQWQALRAQWTTLPARLQKTPKWIPRFALALVTIILVGALVRQTEITQQPIATAAPTQNAPVSAPVDDSEVPTLPFPEVEAPADDALSWWFWLPLGGLALAAAVLLQLTSRPDPAEPAYRREQADSERFRTAIDRCAKLLPSNPRDVVRTVNLMRLEYLLLAAEVDAGTPTSAAQRPRVPPLDEWECVSYTLLQQRHPHLFDPASMKAVLDDLISATAPCDAAVVYDAAAARLEDASPNGSVGSDIATLAEAGGQVGHFTDTAKLRRFLDVNGYVLEVGAQLKRKPSMGFDEDSAPAGSDQR